VEISKGNKAFNRDLRDGEGEESITFIYLKSEKGIFCFCELSLFRDGLKQYP
jgi:hypothetical protein